MSDGGGKKNIKDRSDLVSENIYNFASKVMGATINHYLKQKDGENNKEDSPSFLESNDGDVMDKNNHKDKLPHDYKFRRYSYFSKEIKLDTSIDTKVKESVEGIFDMYGELFVSDMEPGIDLFKQQLIDRLSEILKLNYLNERLSVIYQYEKNYLDLIKDYKEEIKFACTIQEDLRKERSKFFSSILSEVSTTLKSSQVDEMVAAKWITDLVSSYTKSLDVSSELLDESSLDSFNALKKKSKQEIDSIDK